MKSGALYIRVSTDKQEELSPDAQKRLLLEYAQKNDIVISEDYIFLENGISGKKADKRPQFQKMIGLAKTKEHPIDVILVWKYSRFARNQEESIVYKSLLSRNNVDVISVSEPIIEGPFGSLIERIIEWMDEYYSIRLSGEVTRGMTENALRGGYNAAPPFGYDSVKGGIPTINTKQASVVNNIFNWYANEGMTFVWIARKLNDSNIRTKRGGIFEIRTIKYIINNPFYIGKIRWNRQHHEDHTIRNEDEWIIADGKHEPIISSELFYRATERCKSESIKLPRKRSQESCKHWLSGTLVCSTCGRSLTHCVARDKRNGKAKEYQYFQCYAYLKGSCKESHYISDKKITSEVVSALKERFIYQDVDYELIPSVSIPSDSLIDIQKKLDKIRSKEQRIKAAYIDGIDTLEEYKSNKSALQVEKEKLESLLKEESTTPIRSEYTDNLMIQKLGDVISILESDASDVEKGNAIRSICEKIVYDRKNDTLKFYMYQLY